MVPSTKYPEVITMNKNDYKSIKLAKGEMHVYDFGQIKLHAYRTDDFISDEVFIVEKNGRATVIESPCFFDNNAALENYLKDMKVEGILIAYHDAGGNFLPNAKKFATQNAKDYGEKGGGKALIDNFTNVFGDIFDSRLHNITDIIDEGDINIGGIDFKITKTAEAYDIEIPEINAVYTHMLGHDCHSIIGGEGHADAVIKQLQDYIEKGYSLILTSHYVPEDLKDAQTKIDYLRQLKETAKACADAEEFKGKLKSLYPEYSGENYLDMTAAMFFAK